MNAIQYVSASKDRSAATKPHRTIIGLCIYWLILFVFAHCAAGKTANEGQDSRTLQDRQAPQVVGALAFTGISANALTVSWSSALDDVTPITSLRYRLVWAVAADLLDTISKVDNMPPEQVSADYLASIGSTSISGLQSGTTYFCALVVADEAGNKALYPLGSVSTNASPDITPPATGSAINFGDIQSRYIEIRWGAATDTVTLQPFLQYKLVKDDTSSTNIDTLAEAEAKIGSDLLVNYRSNITSFTALNLSPSTQYYFAVIVRDASGNKALYSPAAAMTLASDFFRNTLKFRLNGADKTWNILWQPELSRIGKTQGEDGANHLFSLDALGAPPSDGAYTEMNGVDFVLLDGSAQYTASCSGSSIMVFFIVTSEEITGNFGGTLRNCMIPEGSPGATATVDNGVFRVNRS